MTVGFSACRDELAVLLADVRQKLSEASHLSEAKYAILVDAQSDLLEAFAQESRSQDPFDINEAEAIRKLDEIAYDTSITIQVTALGVAVDRIAARSAELAAIQAELERQTLANVEDAKRLRLAPLQTTLTQMTDLVVRAKVLAKELKAEEPDEKGIIDAVEDMALQLKKFHDSFAKVGTA